MTGNTVTLSGSDSQNATCSGSSFSFAVSQSVDGTYNFSLAQTDPSSALTSSAVTAQWIRDSVAPSAPTVTSPGASPYASSETGFTLSGGCVTGDTVTLGGALSDSTTCASSSYSFTIDESVDGTYNFTINETDLAGNTSFNANWQWIRSTTGPSVPTITTPASSPYHSNASSLTISGACTSGNTVLLGGSSSQSVACASSAYSFTVNQTADGTYSFDVTQKDAANNVSSAAHLTWVRDTLAPAAVSLTTPATNPAISGDASLTVTGICETGATVSYSGSSSGSVGCSASSFGFTYSPGADGTYTLNIIQTDTAGNASSSNNLQWTRNTAMPATPTITSPSANPYRSNGSSITITVTCISGNPVYMEGASTQTGTCTANNDFTFSAVNQSVDGTYIFSIYQSDQTTSTNSNSVSFTWLRDTVAPTTPTIVNPASSPYTSSGNLTISGDCETGNTVNLAGSSSQWTTCAASTYSFTVVESVDSTYDYTVSQSDSAGNASATVALQWVRNSTLLTTPTITTPASSSITNNNSSETVAGGCTTDNTVTLTGSSNQSTTCVNSAYSFTVAAALDGTYSYSVTQSNINGSSAAASLSWTRDTAAPTTTISSTPAARNLVIAASFAFSSADSTAIQQCSLDGGAWTTCVSPVTYSGISNASHTFFVRSVDSAGNIENAPPSYTWTQEAYNTIALYHFDTSTGAGTDSGNYTGAENNGLTGAGTTGATGVFSEAITLNGTSQALSVADTETQNVLTNTMTLEGRVKLAGLPTAAAPMVVISHMGGTGQYGWEFGIMKMGVKYYLYFKGSLNGTSITTVKSSAITISTGTWYHLAVTWNKGSLQFFLDGTAQGSGTIGTAGSSTLFVPSSTEMYVGATKNAAGTVESYLKGTIDECRVSQTIRWTGSFSVPGSAYSAD